ncbi:MAG: hypothetical protein ABFD25_04140 [Clostridiaceae bacterium]
MTTINCSSDCKHQHDGKCTYENACFKVLSVETDCIFYEKKLQKSSPGFICKPSNELL